MSGLLLGKVFWLAAPVVIAGIVHMIVVRRDLFAALRVPLDGGRTLGGRPIFGPNKTWRGLVFMTLASMLLGAFQGLAWGAWAERAGVAPCDLARVPVGLHVPEGPLAQAVGYAIFNFVLGLGYALGELPNSFVKRRIGIEPGKTSSKVFFVVDQADSVVAALGLGAIFFPLEGTVVVVGMLALTGVHLALNAGLWLARIRRNL